MINDLMRTNGISRVAFEERQRHELPDAPRDDVPAQPSAERMVARMLVLIERQIGALEAKFEKDGLMSDSDLRQLETAAKTIDKLIGLDTGNTKGAPEAAKIDPELAQIRDRLIAKVRALDTK